MDCLISSTSDRNILGTPEGRRSRRLSQSGHATRQAQVVNHVAAAQSLPFAMALGLRKVVMPYCSPSRNWSPQAAMINLCIKNKVGSKNENTTTNLKMWLILSTSLLDNVNSFGSWREPGPKAAAHRWASAVCCNCFVSLRRL